MKRQNETRRECVLRALAATDIAETCSEPRLRASFFARAERWLDQAARDEDAPVAAGSRIH